MTTSRARNGTQSALDSNAYPWANAGASQYIADVKANLADRVWRTARFLAWRPSSLPTGLKLR